MHQPCIRSYRDLGSGKNPDSLSKRGLAHPIGNPLQSKPFDFPGKVSIFFSTQKNDVKPIALLERGRAFRRFGGEPFFTLPTATDKKNSKMAPHAPQHPLHLSFLSRQQMKPPLHRIRINTEPLGELQVMGQFGYSVPCGRNMVIVK